MYYRYIPIYTHTYICLLGFPHGSAGKESACNAEDLGFIPGLGRFPGEGYPLQHCGLENSMDYSPWGCRVDMTNDFHFYFLICLCTYIYIYTHR